MFRNPGSKMKIAAHVLFWLSLIGTLVLAYAMSDEFDEILIFAAVAIGGAAVSFLSSLTLYGIGDAIEDIASTRYIASYYYEKEREKEKKEKASSPKASTPIVHTETGSFHLSDYV